MAKRQRNPTTCKAQRHPLTNKIVRGESGVACCCNATCCGSDCLLVQWTGGDWPVSFQYTIATPTQLTMVADFLRNSAQPWKLERASVGCRFGLECEINQFFDDEVHFVKLTLVAVVYPDNTGRLTATLFGWMTADDITTEPSHIIYIQGMEDTPALADSAGCDQTITQHAFDGLGPPPGYEIVTIKYGFGTDCDIENAACLSEPNCDTCCPETTCYLLTGTVTYTPLGGGTPFDIDYEIPLGRGLLGGGVGGSCWYVGVCYNEDFSAFTFQAIAHIVCDDNGVPSLYYFGLIDYTHNGATIIVGALPFAGAAPIPSACGEAIELTDGFFTQNVPHIYDSATWDLTLTPHNECDDVDHCASPPHPPPCDVDCIMCADCTICPTNATLTFHYEIHPGECGVCSVDILGDGCGRCCDEPCFDFSGGALECDSHIAANEAACLAIGGTCWYCAPGCTEEGGTGASTCSRGDFAGDVELAFTGYTGNEIHFGATLVEGPTTIVFDVWFNCTTERWYASIIINGHCVFEGDINGDCYSFGTIELAGRDTDIAGSDCDDIGGGSSLTDGVATYPRSCPV